ncbi:MAG: protein kinase [Acidobacteria bacterium]|nr:protein kinase [Acidobacteriota bacterium]
MKTCITCGKTFPDGQRYCPYDGAVLSSAPAMDDVGRVVDGRYRILEVVAQGGMGKVYKVEHLHLGQVFAMKVIRKDLLGGRGMAERFRREALTTSQIGHANIVYLTDFGFDPDLGAYFVMEYLEGKKLKDLIRAEAPMPLRRVHHLLAQIGDALGAAHAKGVVHRDLKPENIIILNQGTLMDFVKVLDFGIAGLLETDESLTRPGALMGSPYYISPEQSLGQEPDPRSDVYALGVILYQLLTGELPFKGQTVAEVLNKHRGEKPVPPSAARPEAGIPPVVDAVVLKALAKNADDRFPTVRDLTRAFWQGVVQASTPPAAPRSTLSAAGEPVPAAPPTPEPDGSGREMEARLVRGDFPVRNGKPCVARLEIRFRDLDRFRFERITNLRRGGLFVPLGEEIPTLSHIEVALTHPTTGHTLEAGGDVVYVARREKDVTGLGFDIDPSDRARLAQFLEAQRALEPTPGIPDDAVYETLPAARRFPLDNLTRAVLDHITGHCTLGTLKNHLGREAEHIADLIPYLVKHGVVRRAGDRPASTDQLG